MKNNNELSLQYESFNVNDFFKCQENILALESERKFIDAEAVLMQHLARAFQLLDGGK